MINKTAQNKHLVILTASSGLGSFIPAVTLSHYLQSIGYSVELCCIEQLYHAKAIVQFNQTRDLCARDMRAAKLAQQLINDARTDILLAIDQNRWQELLHRWQHQQCKKFIIFSGFWLPLLAELASKTEHAISFDAIHMDATHSSSWKHCDSLLACRHIWLFNADTQEVSALTPVTKVKTWQHRSAIVACHGGGWNIGNVKSPLQTLFQHEISTLSYVTQPPNDVINKLQHFIKIQANWQPWMQG
ncbi:hypothetical protein, partial [Paraglaciecola sp.]|uniref:hypothetical protein n=1 Tax=Paraglaciecola sp. TaxID=1920173 RepID=UPI0030F41F5A